MDTEDKQVKQMRYKMMMLATSLMVLVATDTEASEDAAINGMGALASDAVVFVDSTYDAPLRYGETIAFDLPTGGEARMTVERVVRGDDAAEIIAREYPNYGSPGRTFEWALVYVRVIHDDDYAYMFDATRYVHLESGDIRSGAYENMDAALDYLAVPPNEAVVHPYAIRVPKGERVVLQYGGGQSKTEPIYFEINKGTGE